RANVDGKSNSPTAAACARTTRLKTTSGSATCAATTSGNRDAAYQAAATDARAPATSMAASHAAGRVIRRESGVTTADPIASPAMKAAAIVENAYVVGPMTSASSRVQATSYTSAENPEIATAAHARRGEREDIARRTRGTRR